MKWTEVPAGQVNAAFQRFMVALGDRADITVNRIISEQAFAERLAAYAEDSGISQASARAIMGSRNIFGVEEACRHLGVEPSLRHLASLAEMPFTEATLRKFRDTHILIAVLPLSLFEILRRINRKIFRSHDEGSWYNSRGFQTKCEIGWQLVRKFPVEESFSKTWTEQQVLLHEDEACPAVQTMMYTMICHYLSTGERLFEKVYVRCSDSDAGGTGVRIGSFRADGFAIDTWKDDIRGSTVGLAAANK